VVVIWWSWNFLEENEKEIEGGEDDGDVEG